MKHNNYIKTLALGGIALFSMASCSLDYEPISQPSELTQGSSSSGSTAVLKDKDAADKQLSALYELLRSRIEHMHCDYLLLGDSHTDNAYAGKSIFGYDYITGNFYVLHRACAVTEQPASAAGSIHF